MSSATLFLFCKLISEGVFLWAVLIAEVVVRDPTGFLHWHWVANAQYEVLSPGPICRGRLCPPMYQLLSLVWGLNFFKLYTWFLWNSLVAARSSPGLTKGLHKKHHGQTSQSIIKAINLMSIFLTVKKMPIEPTRQHSSCILYTFVECWWQNFVCHSNLYLPVLLIT